MKKIIFITFMLFGFLCEANVSARTSNDDTGEQVSLTVEGEPFERPTGSSSGSSRTLAYEATVSAYLEVNNVVKICFSEPVGEVEITVSCDGVTIYSTVENILAMGSTYLMLPETSAGNCLLEIKSPNGAYAYGYFVTE